MASSLREQVFARRFLIVERSRCGLRYFVRALTILVQAPVPRDPAAQELGAAVDLEVVKDSLRMLIDRMRRELEPGGDFFIAVPLEHAMENLAHALRQLCGGRNAVLGQWPPDQLRDFAVQQRDQDRLALIEPRLTRRTAEREPIPVVRSARRLQRMQTNRVLDQRAEELLVVAANPLALGGVRFPHEEDILSVRRVQGVELVASHLRLQRILGQQLAGVGRVALIVRHFAADDQVPPDKIAERDIEMHAPS